MLTRYFETEISQEQFRNSLIHSAGKRNASSRISVRHFRCTKIKYDMHSEKKSADVNVQFLTNV